MQPAIVQLYGGEGYAGKVVVRKRSIYTRMVNCVYINVHDEKILYTFFHQLRLPKRV